jgi:hypothetical protein
MSWGWSSTTKITGLAFCVALFLFIAITKSSVFVLPQFGSYINKAHEITIMQACS